MSLQPGGRIISAKAPWKLDRNGLTHSMSYSAQSPWLRNQTIKDNILFGLPYVRERYDAVLDCCALLADLNVLENGDLTEVGARCV